MDNALNEYRNFIESIKKQPCLWKSDMEEYKMLEIKEEAWKNVMEDNSIGSLKEAKYIWKKLRDVHRQAVSKKNRTSNGKMGKKWRYEDQMDFLLPYMKIRVPTIDFPQDQDLQDDDEDPEEVEALDDNVYNESTTAKQLRKSEKMEHVYLNEIKREKQSLDRNSNLSRSHASEEVSISEVSIPRSALENFFSSMCEMTSTLPEHLQIKVERKIFDVVMEARELNLQSQLSYFEN